MSLWKGNNLFVNGSDMIVQEKRSVPSYPPVFTVESGQDVFGFCLAVELNCHRDFWMQWSVNSYHPLGYVGLQVWGKSDGSLKPMVSRVSLRQRMLYPAPFMQPFGGWWLPWIHSLIQKYPFTSHANRMIRYNEIQGKDRNFLINTTLMQNKLKPSNFNCSWYYWVVISDLRSFCQAGQWTICSFENT